MNTLTFNHVTKRYGERTALSEASFELTPGIYGLIGSNGAGKSTMMNLIVGNILPDAGSILWNGENILKIKQGFRAQLGFMPQHQEIYGNFTGIQFLSYMAALKGMSKLQAKKEIPQWLEHVGLQDMAYQRLKTYSGGMKQRILIAQAMLNHPAILILDEPTAGLDPKQRIMIRNLLSKSSRNQIILIATHVVSDVETIAKQMILLREGIVIAVESIETLLRQIDGTVFEVQISEDPEVLRQFGKISNIALSTNGLRVRILAEQRLPEQYSFIQVPPTLEDVYLYWFGDTV